MSWDQPRLTRLRRLLVGLYPREADQRRIAAEAGLREEAIAFEASAENSWFNILRHANHLHKVDALLAQVCEEYPNNDPLKALATGPSARPEGTYTFLGLGLYLFPEEAKLVDAHATSLVTRWTGGPASRSLYAQSTPLPRLPERLAREAGRSSATRRARPWCAPTATATAWS
jgi:hypothetical protein